MAIWMGRRHERRSTAADRERFARCARARWNSSAKPWGMGARSGPAIGGQLRHRLTASRLECAPLPFRNPDAWRSKALCVQISREKHPTSVIDWLRIVQNSAGGTRTPGRVGSLWTRQFIWCQRRSEVRSSCPIYDMALDEFFRWYAQEPGPGFTKATVSAWRVTLEERGLGSSIIIRMSAIRKLA